MASNKVTVQATPIKNIDVSKFSLGKIQEKFVPVLYNSSTFVCQTPLLEVSDDIKIGPHSIIELNTLFKGDKKQRIHSFFKAIDNIECKMIELISNRGKWFTKDIKSDKVKVTNKSIVRDIPNDGTTFIRWPLNAKNNIFVDENDKQMSYDKIKCGSLVKIIFELPFLWIKDKQYGLFIRVQKVQIHVPKLKPKSHTEYVFHVSESDVDDIDESLDKDTVQLIDRLATEQAPPKSKPTEPRLSVRFMDNSVVELLNKNNDTKMLDIDGDEYNESDRSNKSNEPSALKSDVFEYDLTKNNEDIKIKNDILDDSEYSDLGTEFDQSLLQ